MVIGSACPGFSEQVIFPPAVENGPVPEDGVTPWSNRPVRPGPTRRPGRAVRSVRCRPLLSPGAPPMGPRDELPVRSVPPMGPRRRDPDRGARTPAPDDASGASAPRRHPVRSDSRGGPSRCRSRSSRPNVPRGSPPSNADGWEGAHPRRVSTSKGSEQSSKPRPHPCMPPPPGHLKMPEDAHPRRVGILRRRWASSNVPTAIMHALGPGRRGSPPRGDPLPKPQPPPCMPPAPAERRADGPDRAGGVVADGNQESRTPLGGRNLTALVTMMLLNGVAGGHSGRAGLGRAGATGSPRDPSAMTCWYRQ